MEHLEHVGHLGLIAAPLLVVAVFRFRKLLPTALLLLTFFHNHLEPLPTPGAADHSPPPLCCLLAQSLEASKTVLTTEFVLLRCVPVTRANSPRRSATRQVAIRAPPTPDALPAPASWTSVSRAA